MDAVVYVDEQRMSRSDCTDMHAHLYLRSSQMTYWLFPHVDNIWNHFRVTCYNKLKFGNTNSAMHVLYLGLVWGGIGCGGDMRRISKANNFNMEIVFSLLTGDYF